MQPWDKFEYLTARDIIAIEAMKSILDNWAARHDPNDDVTYAPGKTYGQRVAKLAYGWADALLAEGHPKAGK
jgi:hypothetical protein